MSFGYINLLLPMQELVKKDFFIEVEKKKYEAVLEPRALHDPDNLIIRQ